MVKISLIILLLTCSCTLFKDPPPPLSTQQRVKQFQAVAIPTEKPVEIRFNKHLFPFITSQTDADLFTAWGAVHGFLRLGQMELLRIVAEGRISELAGPFTSDIDILIRTIDYQKAGKAFCSSLNNTHKQYLQAYVKGLNAVANHSELGYPHEYVIFNLKKRLWSVNDICTIARLASTDVSWMIHMGIMYSEATKKEKNEFFKWIRKYASSSLPSFGSSEKEILLDNIFKGLNKSGSNSLAISPQRSQTGSALISNDPHLSFTFPNFWVGVGIKSPSYHAVGFSIPGLPMIAVGRNPNVAWGGTNMRAPSSHFIEVSKKDIIEERKIKVAVRGWVDEEHTVRLTKYGPIVSDAPLFNTKKIIALRWLGHEPSNEFAAFLSATKAKTSQEFRNGFASYGVSSQNILYATSSGDIGQLMAYKYPFNGIKLSKDNIFWKPNETWKGTIPPHKMPFSENPAKGFIASANNMPTTTNPPTSLFFSPSYRFKRLEQLATSTPKVDIATLQKWHLDVYSELAIKLVNELRRRKDLVKGEYEKIQNILFNWDGHYRTESQGPVVLETLVYELATEFIDKEDISDEVSKSMMRSPYLLEWLAEKIPSAEKKFFAEIFEDALDEAQDKLDDFKNWGERHKLKLGYILARLPATTGKYILYEGPIAGSRSTLMKASHGTKEDEINTFYGAQARHISDLGNPDQNYFLLLGGQDGWLLSENNADMMDKWMKGELMHVPMTRKAVEKSFTLISHK